MRNFLVAGNSEYLRHAIWNQAKKAGSDSFDMAITTDEAGAYLVQDLSGRLADAEIVEKEPGPHPMEHVRLSSPLLEQLDRIAIAKGRPSEILIHRVLWEFVHQQETD